MANVICGVDTASQPLDARIGRQGKWDQFRRTAAGIAELATFYQDYYVDLVVMDATGGYERLPFDLL